MAASPAREGGLTVTDALRGMGTQDAFGGSTPQGTGYDIGAMEYRLLNPDPATARITGLFQQAGGWQLQFGGMAGRSYRVESSTDLILWNKSGTAIENAAGSFEFLDRNSNPMRFYRAVARGVPSH
jgi:hypothetical protein